MSDRLSSSLTSPSSLPTVGQLERRLSQALQSSYHQWTGHTPGPVTCHIVGQVINVLIKDSITPLEALLQASQAKKVRNGVNENIRDLIAELVTGICGVSAESVMLDSNTHSGLTGIIVLLATHPQVRERKRKTQPVPI